MLVPPAQLVLKDGLLQGLEGLKGLGRLWLSMRGAQAEFQRNVADWAKGGPNPRGFTREGPPIPTPDCELTGVSHQLIDADECFAKNRPQTMRWHVAFLQTYVSGGDLQATAYWREYLGVRLSPEAAQKKASRFTALYDTIAARGCRPGSYVWLADLASAPGLQSHFGFRYFRFDGAHRLSCLYVLGARQIPCLVFSVRTQVPRTDRRPSVKPDRLAV